MDFVLPSLTAKRIRSQANEEGKDWPPKLRAKTEIKIAGGSRGKFQLECLNGT